jgi:hypothetical protein
MSNRKNSKTRTMRTGSSGVPTSARGHTQPTVRISVSVRRVDGSDMWAEE